MFLRIVAVLCSLSALWAGNPDQPGGASLQAVFARMDRASAGFKSFTAKVRHLTHTDAINQDDIDSGSIKLKRSKPGDMKMLIELTEPDPKTVTVQGKKAEIYYPRMQTVQEYDMGKYKEWLDQFYLLGFGTTSKELLGAYTVKLLGPASKGDQKVTGLELVPKSKDIGQHIKKFELWISDDTGLPVEQRIFPPGQYIVVTYSAANINPDLPDSALKLLLPKGTKREFPQK
jgi:outer membrane lipoprotein-sorting protein